ncbi:MAG TPA: 5-oxoprolinase subunit PxpB [Caulobacteraceae bacterium]|jgi:KipI family sensor histidine kinase inhibitor|nr:5-oxoprolinase subunit PxpB [Caulobacteraceae bacterium]
MTEHDLDPELHGARISLLGCEAVLFDVGGARFEDLLQRRVWTTCEAAAELEGVREAIPGMNNFTVSFDPGRWDPRAIASALRRIWTGAEPAAGVGRLFEAPTIYGGPVGDELAELAERIGLSIEETVRLHADAEYVVAAVGAMPGFPYLAGLDPRLTWPRHASPRPRVAAGTVMIGGAQTGVMPCEAPTGWHCLGRTSLELFNPERDPPALLAPGDRLRFVIEDIRL